VNELSIISITNESLTLDLMIL